MEIELGDCLLSIIALGLARGTHVPSAWSGPWSLFVTPCSSCWLLPWTMTARCRLVLTRFICARSSHASSTDRLQYPLHEAIVLALRFYHPAMVGGIICVIIKGAQVICIVASICADKLNIVTLAVEVSPVLTEETVGCLVAENLAVDQLFEWKAIGIAVLPGVISLVAGLLMWVTSLQYVRKHYFELFFYTHQLYIVFVVFLALHVGDYLFSIVAGGIFLFILDRFLRFCQSRRTVDVISAKSFPCGTLELVLSKPPSNNSVSPTSNLKHLLTFFFKCPTLDMRYNALSFVFLQVRELSWLQWHPFSVSSSPLDGKHHVAVLIKVLGGWTAKLRDKLSKLYEAENPDQLLSPLSYPKITTCVEGPYGHESPYHLAYENLVLVAGGIGISPFFAILSDILQRKRDGKACLPKKVLVIWAIKNSDELSLLSSIDIPSLCPSFSQKMNLEINIYVTRQSEPLLEDGMVHKMVNPSVKPRSNGCPMSVLVGTGDNIWSGLYLVSSTIGFVLMITLLDIFYINKFNITAWWYKGLLFVVCMVASVLIFGGLVVVFWNLWGEKAGDVEPNGHDKVTTNGEELHNPSAELKGLNTEDDIQSFITTRYGTRPDFKEIFESLNEKWGSVDVGVIVCGPASLQSTVAKEIRSHSIWRSTNHPLFHFNSHSFDL
ncbi:hypothetical protein F2Q68_00021021 [Brassica cretica]|uniref:ferric-chelate reductase (NADH) n=1 Tax=Brassica cretica TaxID=69181 RepID=A0A8S9FYN7_BRACR|nr:hypothetical protein F2Q68_00021021 [Brassica cretica]